MRTALLERALPNVNAAFAAEIRQSYFFRAYFSPNLAVLWMISTTSSFGALRISFARGYDSRIFNALFVVILLKTGMYSGKDILSSAVSFRTIADWRSLK